MSVGLSLSIYPPGSDRIVEDHISLAQAAEDLGFESLWHGEHHVSPRTVSQSSAYYGRKVPGMPSPLIRLAGVAAATKRIKIGTAVLLLPQRHPLLLAKELATLDRDSGGRLLVGVGMGWNAAESRIMGADFKRRAAQTEEAVSVLRSLWTEDFVEFDGDFYRFPPVSSRPGPAQTPHPPILLGMHSDRAFPRVARYGDGWLPAILDPADHATIGPRRIEFGRRQIDIECDRLGRSLSGITVSVIITDDPELVDRQTVARYLKAGADRVILLGSARDQREQDRQHRDWLSRTADRVL